MKKLEMILRLQKLGLISHLVLVFLLLNLSMLLQNKLCSIAQVSMILYIPLETGRKLNVHKSFKRLF